MPFEKPTPTACEPRGRRTLLLALALFVLSLLLAGIGCRAAEGNTEGGPIGEMMESPAIVAFLGLSCEDG